MGYWAAEWIALPEALVLCAGILDKLAAVLEGLEVDPERMLANLELTRGQIMAEAVMMELGRDLGHERAHDLVLRAARRASAEGRGLADVLAEEPDVAERFSGRELDRLLEGEPGGSTLLVAPNRRSVQGGLGGAQWAGLEPELHRLHLTPESARLLLARRGLEIESLRTPFGSRGLRSMIQTLVNAFTLRDNFIRNSRSGRLSAEDIGRPS